MSLKYTNSEESNIAHPVDKHVSIPTISGNSSQLSIGRTPESSAKIEHDDQVQRQVEQRQQHHRRAGSRGAGTGSSGRAPRCRARSAPHRRGLGEEREQHDRTE